MSLLPIPKNPSDYALDTADAIFPTTRYILRSDVIPLATAIDKTDTGGWFTVWHQPSDEFHGYSPVFGGRIGRITGAYPPAMLQTIANEKAERLARYRSHFSSWESRDVSHPDPLQHKYGGAIRVSRGMIFSFSGLAEHFDEMAMVLAAIHLKLITRAQVDHIIEVSRNVHLSTYLKERGLHIPELL